MGIKQINKVTASEKGTAILIALALIAMLSSVAIMSVNRSTTDIELSYNQLHEDRAFYVAEAGLQRALVEFNNDPTWRNGYYKEVLDGGYYTLLVLDSIDDAGYGDSVLVQSIGYFTTSMTTLEVWLVPEFYKPFEFALFSDVWLRLSGGCVDSYNSDSGSYAETQSDSGANIGTNGDLWLRDSAIVGGDVFVSIEGTYDIDSNATIMGDLLTEQEPLEMPIVPDSEFTWAQDNNSAPAGFTGSYDYSGDDLTINDNDTLVLSGGVYYFRNITLKDNASIQIAPGESVIIYAGQHLELKDNSSMNPGGKPKDLIIYASSGSRLRIDDYAEFRGAYWGPGATFRMRNTSEVYGSINIERETIDLVEPNAPCFHYDRALADYMMKSAFKGYELIAWREL